MLTAAGFAVIAAPVADDGRPAISKGFVDKAKKAAQDVVAVLKPFAEKGTPIVGLEPSSILSLRDEFLYLLPKDSPAQLVADHAYTFEEFIAKLADGAACAIVYGGAASSAAARPLPPKGVGGHGTEQAHVDAAAPLHR
ncbi:MAG: hypothetical protein M5U34_36645 [Chloroflexi bacterium]|nr:hypothetical protein [Chloroflexota bacterium]